MPVVLLVLGLVVLFVIGGIAAHFDARVRKHGPHALTWRFLSGEAWPRPGGYQQGMDSPGVREGADGDRVRAPPAGSAGHDHRRRVTSAEVLTRRQRPRAVRRGPSPHW
jgi:hypothetical protein